MMAPRVDPAAPTPCLAMPLGALRKHSSRNRVRRVSSMPAPILRLGCIVYCSAQGIPRGVFLRVFLSTMRIASPRSLSCDAWVPPSRQLALSPAPSLPRPSGGTTRGRSRGYNLACNCRADGPAVVLKALAINRTVFASYSAAWTYHIGERLYNNITV